MNSALFSPYKVLFVDDEAMAVKYFRQTLEDTVGVLTATSVDEAIAILGAEHAHIGVLVTDQRMPGKQGTSLLQYACEHYPHITRILATAYADLTDAIAAVNSGEIFRYIKKPWDSEQLIVDIKIAMDVFVLTQERDELINAKMSVFQQLVVLGRIKDLVLMGTALQVQFAQAPSAIKSFLTDAQQLLNAAGQRLSVDVDQLDLAQNLVVETQRSTALMAELARPYVAHAMTPVQEKWSLAMQVDLQALHWPAHPAYTQMKEALLLCYQSPPALTVQGNALEIKGAPVQGPQHPWGVLTDDVGDDLTQATQWLRLYLWAAECGLAVRLQQHTATELCMSLSQATGQLQGTDAQWLDDLFDQFSH